MKIDVKKSLNQEQASPPLLSFSNKDHWTLQDSFEGTAIMGTNGSGKTSGCGKTIALQMLRNGYGGLVLTSKNDECALWEYYAQCTDRSSDLLIMQPGGSHRFNFIDYEARLQKGAGVGLAANIADIVLKLSDVSEAGTQQNDAFWRGEQTKVLINPIETLILSGQELTPKSIYDIVISAPGSEEELASVKWRENSACYQALLSIRRRIELNELSQGQVEDYRGLEDYWLYEHCRLHEKTRGIVRAMFTSFFSEFQREPNRTLFCGDTTVTPEVCLQGKILIINLPVSNYNKVGAVAQKLMKLMFQRTVERSLEHLGKRTQAFLWADEFQNFFYDHDIKFQATARSSQIATVYLTQNLPNTYVAAGGGQIGENKIKALLGNLNTKFFLANDCPITNRYASELIGQNRQWRENQNTSLGGGGGMSVGKQESFDLRLRPEAFHALKTGGSKNDFLVEAYMIQTGVIFHYNNSPVLKTIFNQNFQL